MIEASIPQARFDVQRQAIRSGKAGWFLAVLLPARASKLLLKKGEKCHQVLCRGCGATERRKNVEWVEKKRRKEGKGEEGRARQSRRTNEEANSEWWKRDDGRRQTMETESGRSLNGDRSHEDRRSFWLSREGFVRVICRATTSGNV